MKNLFIVLFLFVVIIFVSSCSKEDTPAATPYDTANGSKGGIMYDKFWSTEAGYDQNSTKLASLNAKSDFFRCKQCHAWDLKGSSGSYNNRAPKTSRPNVSSFDLLSYTKSHTAQQLFDGMKKTAGRRAFATDLSTYNPATPSTQIEGDKMPNYNELMSDAQIWDLVKFMKESVQDVSQLYDATYSGVYPAGTTVFANIGKDGNATNGNAYYKSNCIACHGADGKLIPNLDATPGMTVGKFIRTKPNELQHKIKFGQLGTGMVGEFDITIAQMKDLYKAGTNETTFPN